MKPENLTSILNKLHAMHAAEIITIKEVADAIGTREQRAGEWILRNAKRERRPNGEMAIKLLAFAANRTLHISRRPQLAERYRNAFEAACMKFPVEGDESRQFPTKGESK